jgi:hypothetical protein
MYAKIENGAAVEYPLFEGDLERRFPQYRFPLDDPKSIEFNGGKIIPEGYVNVIQSLTPTDDYRLIYNMVMPVKVDGVWRQSFTTEPRVGEDLDKYKNFASNNLRKERDALLAESDRYVVSDRWEKYSDQQKLEWSDYRQELRDVTTQADFPSTVIWPIKPLAFSIKVL